MSDEDETRNNHLQQQALKLGAWLQDLIDGAEGEGRKARFALVLFGGDGGEDDTEAFVSNVHPRIAIRAMARVRAAVLEKMGAMKVDCTLCGEPQETKETPAQIYARSIQLLPAGAVNEDPGRNEPVCDRCAKWVMAWWKAKQEMV